MKLPREQGDILTTRVRETCHLHALLRKVKMEAMQKGSVVKTTAFNQEKLSGGIYPLPPPCSGEGWLTQTTVLIFFDPLPSKHLVL